MKAYEIETSIAAPPEVVWSVLTNDLPKSPEAFGILRFEGDVEMNAKIKLWSEVAPDRAFALKVTTFEGPKKMVWRGGMPLGMFTGTRTFTLSPQNGGTKFKMQEVFTGLLSSMITKSMPDLTPSFTKFSQALKTKAEAQ